MSKSKQILITGGAGFIGSHLVRRFVKRYPEYKIYNLDSLSYAGNLENLTDIQDEPNYHFVKGNIVDRNWLFKFFDDHIFSGIIHLAAESHVDRSIVNPIDFIQTNVIGTVNLLDAAKNQWTLAKNQVFYHISTDEVYGSLESSRMFTETTPYAPRSPYSASKASSDHFVRAYSNTYGLPIKMSNCSNNYGPYQFPEKLIPLFINNIINQKTLPVYGEGANVRDWLYVEDHTEAIDLIYHEGREGETFNIGGKNEWKNIELVRVLCQIMDTKLKRPIGTSANLIKFVKDRAGHDLRYAIDPSKIEEELNWSPKTSFEAGLNKTIDWYLENQRWLDHVTSGLYQEYYKEQYG